MFVVKTYEEFEARSDPSVPPVYSTVGSCESADEAIILSKRVVVEQLKEIMEKADTFRNAREEYCTYGEIPIIEPFISFNHYKFLDEIENNLSLLHSKFEVRAYDNDANVSLKFWNSLILNFLKRMFN